MITLSSKQVFTILTNKSDGEIISLYEEISLASEKLGHTYLLYHNKEDCPVPNLLKDKNHYCFTNNVLGKLNYIPISNELLPGSNHFALLDFYKTYPYYDYYWYIEDDVRFNGEWEYFFHFISSLKKPPDFISCYIREFVPGEDWPWWQTLHHSDIHVPFNMRMASFNPIYRISNAALSHIDKMLLRKWQGHHEVLLPTILYHDDFHICDFGGSGKYVLPGMENKFYISNSFDTPPAVFESTLRYRPCIQKMDKINKLYHPVKASCYYENSRCRICRTIY